MPYFMVRLEGTGISIRVADEPDPIIGFYCTRRVRESDIDLARQAAKDVVLAEWLPGGKYATRNAGAPPFLVVDAAWSVGLLSGIFHHRPAGYTFYSQGQAPEGAV
jgi:hypothetical protein